MTDPTTTLVELLKHGAPGKVEAAKTLVAEIQAQVTFAKESGARIGTALKLLRPALKKSKRWLEVVKTVAKATGYTDRQVRNWVDPRPKAELETISNPSVPAPETSKDFAYRAWCFTFDGTRDLADTEFDAFMQELWLTVEYRRGKRRDKTLTLSGLPLVSRYYLDGSLREQEPAIEEAAQ